MQIGKGTIKIKTHIIKDKGWHMTVINGENRMRFKASQADIEVFEKAVKRRKGWN